MTTVATVPLSYVFAPLGVEERRALERFIRRVDAVNASGLTKGTVGLRATNIPGATYLGGPAWQIQSDGLDEQTVKAAVGDFRQIYTESSSVSAAKALRVLSASAGRRRTPASREMIEKLRAMKKTLAKRRREDPRGKLLEEDGDGALVERSPEDIIKTWFNGEYFHEDTDLAEQLEPSGHAAVEMMRLSLHTAMRDFMAYWTLLRDLAERVLADPSLDGRN